MEIKTRHATQLLARHEPAENLQEHQKQEGKCCICGAPGPGVAADEAISTTYFSDDDLFRQPETSHVCEACAVVMDQRTYKQGHWLAHDSGVETPSTNDLRGLVADLRAGQLTPPLAFHVTSSPIRSSHAYLWTPVNETLPPLTVAYDRQQIRIRDWDQFEGLVAAIEDLRLAGFTFDEIRSGEPRVRNLQAIGKEDYLKRDATIDENRCTGRLELALTLSRSADDQDRTELTDHNPLTHE